MSILIIFYLPISGIVHCQIVEGKYIDSLGNYISFENGFAEFQFHNLIGGGQYSSNKDKIIIGNDLKYQKGTASLYEFFPDKRLNQGEYLFYIYKENVKDTSSMANVFYHIKRDPYKKSFTIEGLGEKKYIINEMPLDSIIRIHALSVFYYNPLKIKLLNLNGGVFKITLKNGSLLYADEYFSEKKRLKFKYKLEDGILFLTCLFRDEFDCKVDHPKSYTFTFTQVK